MSKEDLITMSKDVNSKLYYRPTPKYFVTELRDIKNGNLQRAVIMDTYKNLNTAINNLRITAYNYHRLESLHVKNCSPLKETLSEDSLDYELNGIIFSIGYSYEDNSSITFNIYVRNFNEYEMEEKNIWKNPDEEVKNDEQK